MHIFRQSPLYVGFFQAAELKKKKVLLLWLLWASKYIYWCNIWTIAKYVYVDPPLSLFSYELPGNTSALTSWHITFFTYFFMSLHYIIAMIKSTYMFHMIIEYEHLVFIALIQHFSYIPLYS